jgi:hypothetical protein
MKAIAAMWNRGIPPGPPPAPVVSIYGDSTWNTDATSKNVTFTPAVGDLVVAIVGKAGAADAGTISDDQGGTYTRAVTLTRSGGSDAIGIFVRDSKITSAVSTTVTVPSATHTGGGMVCYKVTNMTKVGAAAVRSTGVTSNSLASGTAANISMGVTMLATSMVFTTDACQSASSAQTGPAGSIGASGGSFSTPVFGQKCYAYNPGVLSGTNVTWQSGTSSGVHYACAMELDGS